MASEPFLLVVDDDVELLRAFERHLGARGFAAVVAESAVQALKTIEETPLHAAVVDYRLGEDSGIALVTDLRARQPHVPVVLMTAFPSAAVTVAARRAGAIGVLPKPIEIDQVLDLIRACSEHSEGARSQSLRAIKDHAIEQAMRECGGNITLAARRLGIRRQSLQQMLKKL